MKTLLLLFTIATIPLLCKGQAYYPFPQDSASWSQIRWDWAGSTGDPECDIVKHYGLVGDTIVLGKQYSKLYGVNHNYYYSSMMPYKDIPEFNIDSAEYVGGIREDSAKKVQFFEANDTVEYLFYDFGLNVGDTFCFDYFDNVFGPNTCFPVSYIDSILINGQYRRTINLSDWWSTTWIEGIGNSVGWFEFQFIGTWSWSLLCFQQNNDTLINSFGFCNCTPYWLTGITKIDQKINTVKIYPNPATENINIEFKEPLLPYHLKLYSIYDQKLFEKEIGDRQTSIDIQNLNTGIYLLILETKDQTIEQKFIKQ